MQVSPRYLVDPLDTTYTGPFTQDDLGGIYEAMATNDEDWAASFVLVIVGVPNAHVTSEFSRTLFSRTFFYTV